MHGIPNTPVEFVDFQTMLFVVLCRQSFLSLGLPFNLRVASVLELTDLTASSESNVLQKLLGSPGLPAL